MQSLRSSRVEEMALKSPVCGDIIIPDPTIARRMDKTPAFGAVHGLMFNDNLEQ